MSRSLRAAFVALVCHVIFVLACAPARAQSPPCVLAPQDLLAWWPGDSNARDIVGGRHAVTGGGFAGGKVRRAFELGAGEGEFLSVPDDPVWTLAGNDFTVDLWVKLAAVADRLPFVAHEESGATSAKWIFWYDAIGVRDAGPALRFHVDGADVEPADTAVAPWTPAADIWYHLAVTRSGNSYTLYIDGAPVVTETNDTDISDAAAPLTIGRSEGFSFTGVIDEVVLLNGRALTAQEVAAIFQAGPAGRCKCAGLAVTIVASSSGASGTEARDVILGTETDDEIQGNGGNDLICGGLGADTLNGGPGNDRIVAGLGNDRLGGGPGRDRLVGQRGDDDLFGGEGDDLLRGGLGGDFLDGDVGDDRLRGNAGSDRCDGGAGADDIDASCEVQ